MKASNFTDDNSGAPNTKGQKRIQQILVLIPKKFSGFITVTATYNLIAV